MKTGNSWLKLYTLAIIVLLLTAGCGDKGNKGQSGSESNRHMETDSMNDMNHGTDRNAMHEKNAKGDFEHIMINLPTMQCQMCKENIETAVNKLDGIESVDVDKKEKVAHINFMKDRTDAAKIESAITEAGYDANDKKADPEAYSKLDDCCKLPKDRKKK